MRDLNHFVLSTSSWSRKDFPTFLHLKNISLWRGTMSSFMSNYFPMAGQTACSISCYLIVRSLGLFAKHDTPAMPQSSESLARVPTEWGGSWSRWCKIFPGLPIGLKTIYENETLKVQESGLAILSEMALGPRFSYRIFTTDPCDCKLSRDWQCPNKYWITNAVGAWRHHLLFFDRGDWDIFHFIRRNMSTMVGNQTCVLLAFCVN